MPGVLVSAIAAPWEASNTSVVLTPDGVVFGPYADATGAGGSVRYHGLDGQPFSSVKNLAYNMRHTADAGLTDLGATPYLRVYTQDAQGGAHDAIFTPGSQAYPGTGVGPFQEWVATAGTWRFDSDDGSNSEFGTGAPLSDVLAKYGDQTITRISITLGFTAGTNLTGLLRWVQVNGTTYAFSG